MNNKSKVKSRFLVRQTPAVGRQLTIVHPIKSLLFCVLFSALLTHTNAGTRMETATAAEQTGPAAAEQPKYLIFWNLPEKTGELVERVGMKGDGKTRMLGFGLPISTFELEEHAPTLIRRCFSAARENDMAVMLSFDCHIAWRTDLWNCLDKPGYNPNNKYNVEWHGWDGPPNKTSYLNWGGLERRPPQMCFTSQKTRAEVTRIVSKVIIDPARRDCETQGRRQGSPLRGSFSGFRASHRRLLKSGPRAREDDEGRRAPGRACSGYRAILIAVLARPIPRTISGTPSRRSP